MLTTSLRIQLSAPAMVAPPRALAAWIDRAPETGWVNEEVRIAGWCFAPHAVVTQLHLLLGPDRFPCVMGHFRADVAAAYPNSPASPRSGFEAAILAHRPFRGVLRLEATLDDGTTMRFESDKTIHITKRPLAERLTKAADDLANSLKHFAVRRMPGKAAPIRVMCVTNELTITGGPLYLVELVTELKRRGVIDPLVVSPTDGWLRKQLEDSGIKVMIRQRGDAGGAQTALAKEMARGQVQVVYANTIESVHAIAAARQAAIPSFWNIHESEPWREFFGRLSPELSEMQIRSLFAAPHRVMFSTEATRAVYQELEPAEKNFCVVGNAIDPRRILRATASLPRESARQRLGIAPQDIVLLLLGTVCERKGQRDLLLALQQLPAELHERVRTFIVGDRPGAYSASLHAQVERLPASIAGRLTMVQETPETALYYRAADIFVCTSRIESFPRVILEAMHYSLPIITTGVFGIKAQVQSGVNGLFYEPGDIGGLAAALLELLANAPHRTQLAANASGVLRQLNSFDQMLTHYAGILQSAAAAKQI